MKQIYLISVTFILVATHTETSVYNNSPRVVCYYATWTQSDRFDKYRSSDIDSSLATHIIYAYIGIGPNGEVAVMDEAFDIDQNGFKGVVALKKQNTNLKIMAAIGCWNSGRSYFSIVAANETLRTVFVANCLTFLEQFLFDGLDLFWEYPSQGEDSITADKANFVLLVQALKDAFTDKGYLLSAAVSTTQEDIDRSYDVPSLSKLLDFINLKTYDYHGLCDTVTGVNAPLYPQVTDSPDTALTVSTSVKLWIANGADPAKLNVGLATYGNAYTLADASSNGTGAAITEPAYTGPYAGDYYAWTYFEICSDYVNNTSAWKVVNHNNSYVFNVKKDLWIGYDNVDTIYAKAAFAKDAGLGGIMFWALHGDDFKGYCGGGKYPLIKAAIKGYNGV